MRQRLRFPGVRRRDPRPLEATVENRANNEIGKRGGIHRKMNGMGYNSWPDQLYVKPGVARPLWIEYKRLGEEPTVVQGEIHKMLRAAGQRVEVHDTWEAAVAAYDAHRD